MFSDEFIVRWVQWSVRQAELFLGIRHRMLLNLCIMTYSLALLLYAVYFVTHFFVREMPFYIFHAVHLAILWFLVDKFLTFGPLVLEGLEKPIHYRLRAERRHRRFVSFIYLLSVLGSFITIFSMARSPLPDSFQWFSATLLIFVPYFCLEYLLCVEGVSEEELERRQNVRR